MITSELYLEGKQIISEIREFVVNDLGGKEYKDNYLKVNYYFLPKTYMNNAKDKLTQDNIKKLNELIVKMQNSKAFSKLRRTKSNGISIEGKYLVSHPFQYDIVSSTSKNVVTIVSDVGSFKIYVGYAREKEKGETGKTHSGRWIDAVTSVGINLEDYSNDPKSGEIAAANIHKPEVGTVYAIKDKLYEGNIHHLDFHKFYPSGIALLHPEFKEAFKILIENNDKLALDAGTRFLASKHAKYKYAKLIKEGINYMYNRFFEVSDDLERTGRKILAYNTDGIWYQGDVYHGLYEGNDLGEWSNDYINVKQIRFASAKLGKYEFITEDNKYECRVKGTSTYERIKPREEWEWGDIYKTKIISLTYNKITEQFTLID